MSETFRAFEVWLLREHGDRADVRAALQEYKHALAENERRAENAFVKNVRPAIIDAVGGYLANDDRRALAERVREALKAKAKAHACVGLCSCRHIIAMDLAALDLGPLLDAPEGT
jgi:hypothetical protein